MSVDEAIFRAYDIRGTVPDALNADTARLIGRAFATKAMSSGAAKIVVGRDGRLSSPELAAALIDGIAEEGVDTVDVGMVPTPSAYWSAVRLAGGSCAVVTGSHNPKQYNGIKMMLGGQSLTSDDIRGLHTIIAERRYSNRGVTGLREQNLQLMDQYAQALLAGRSLARPLKIVVDCGNGAMGPYGPKILRALGCDVTELFCDVDGNFPNHHPDPSNPANLAAAAAATKQHGAEAALAFDGDGDRLGLWLPRGELIFPDRLLMLLAADLLDRQPGATVLFDVKCSMHTAAFIAGRGGTPRMCRTGHSFLKRELVSSGAPLGGELSGHFYFNEGDWRFDDALLAAVKLLELFAAAKHADQLCATAPASCASPEYLVPMPAGASPHDFVAGLADPQLYPGHRALVTLDGVRAEWKDGFGLVRASNTTPSLILRFEGDDERACERIKGVFRACLDGRQHSLRLPF